MIDGIKGSGTEEDPHRIENIRQLRAVSQKCPVNQKLDGNYKLIDNISSNHTKQREFTPIGDYVIPFTGSFDGNNYEIRNLSIKQPVCVGLFGCIGEGGRVKNVGLVNTAVKGREYVGSLVGHNRGMVVSSYTVGEDVSGNKVVGGLVGYNGGEIAFSYGVAGDASTDGLMSRLKRVFSLCRFQSGVSGDEKVGGLVGFNTGKIESSYATERNLLGDKQVGSLIGCHMVGGQLESCFTLSNSDEDNNPEDSDLVMTAGNHRILYVVETNKLYLQFNDKIYYARDVSPTQAQALVGNMREAEVTDRFKASVVSARQD